MSRLLSGADAIKESMKKRWAGGGEGGAEVDEGGGDDPDFRYMSV